MPASHEIRAEINYLGQMDAAPLSYSHCREKGNLVLDSRTLPITDIRHADTSLEREGAILANLPFGFDGDLQAASGKFRDAYESFIYDLTGAHKVIVLPPMLRYSSPPEPEKVVSTPAPYVHADFTLKSFHDIMPRIIADDPQRDRWLNGRQAIYQTWAALSPPPQDKPLAVVDRSTVGADDLVEGAVMVGPPDKLAPYPAMFAHYNPAHRWYYVSDMTPSDALVFIGWDSAYDALPGALHTSFSKSGAGEKAVPRISCETRAFIFWGD